ncbi:Ribonuclease H-like domain [Phytophthora cactorum]|nr:Ribonuclease H-like domain [Phytophthora cactorum]
MDPALLYPRLPIGYNGVVLSFDGSAKPKSMVVMAAVRGFVAAAEWTVVIAASAFLESTTVNIAEYTGMNQGVKAAIDSNIDDLIIVGDSRLAIQQSLRVIACRKETLQTQLNHQKELTAKLHSVRYPHVVRDYNAAADSLATEAWSRSHRDKFET